MLSYTIYSKDKSIKVMSVVLLFLFITYSLLLFMFIKISWAVEVLAMC
jgi:hypothetical protein